MITAKEAKAKVEAYDKARAEKVLEKATAECEEIGVVIASLAERGVKSHNYYKSSNLPMEVEAIRELLEQNGYKVSYTSATSLNIRWG